LGVVDPRPLALFRIALAIALLCDLAVRSADLREWFTARGVLPLASLQTLPPSLFAISDQPWVAVMLFAIGFLAATALLLGWHARVAAVVLWIFFASLYHRNRLCEDGGDGLARVLLFFTIFADVSAAKSLDRKAGRTALGMVPALPLRLLQLIVVTFYFAVAVDKIRGGWPSGDVLYQILQLRGFARPFGTVLLAHPTLCRMLDHATWISELLLPVLAYLPWKPRLARMAFVLIALGLQVGIGLGMKVGIFQIVAISGSLLWFPAEWLNWLAPAPPAESQPVRPLPRWLLGAAAAQALLLCGHAVLGARLPSVVDKEQKLLAIEIPTDLFSRPGPVFRWTAPGVRADGSSVADVLAVARPETQIDVGWFFSRWIKFTYKSDKLIRWPELGAYLCRRWAEAGDGSLQSFSLLRESRDPTLPGGEVPPFKTEVLLRWDCVNGGGTAPPLRAATPPR
jgi:hypothetical protein